MKRNEEFDWSAVTPESYNHHEREALHVLSVNIIGDENRERVLRFAIARMLHFEKHLPSGSSQRIRFDLRGQIVSNKRLEYIRGAILNRASSNGIQVSVEFLTS